MKRRLSFTEATARYVHRFTGDHVPQWARRPHKGRYYAPQFASDREWYDHTRFPGELGYLGLVPDCYTTGHTWPIGHWLEAPFIKGQITQRDK